MLRVTVELIPYGVESLSKSLAEICIVDKSPSEDKQTAEYSAAGYRLTKDNKIQEFAVEVNDFRRDAGVLALLREVLSVEIRNFDDVEYAEQLLRKTRLYAAGEEEKNEE